ncbi:Extracellular metalloproteinase MEP [Psilocybe cubensis]|uniref:Extracellular metalloproteinase n=2 Tax=Psilocybe cubensis TaxID=181762 RepID=A0A8H7XM84_PSICU|nr:Extracellular metalloproteinase MEP [Psilocybe cubensis]KAH9481998.1 Extracellular metalloproteinase MEP [Psilocybe cubensis]
MVASKRFLTSVLIAVTYSSVASAFQAKEDAFSHSTHRVRHISRELTVETYHPESSYETFTEGLAPRDYELDARAPRDLNSTALAFVQDRLGVDASSVGFKSGYTDRREKFAWVKQYHRGIPFVNAVANVAWKDDKVVAFGNSFVKPKTIAASRPTIPASSIIAKVEAAFDGKYNNWPISLNYLARPDGSAALVHAVQVQNEEVNSWFEVYVDAHSGEILSVTDFVAEATYKVLPLHKRAITEGLETVVDPQDTLASPSGWHSTGTTSFTTTEGNNVVSYKSSVSSTTSQSSSDLVFNYTYSPADAPSATANLNAARVNAFYIINAVHDLAYRYGFTETAFNFQQNNFGKGGKANDRVRISVQDSSGTNNANFATPADGQSGQCRMYIWTYTTPNRDGSLENDIIVHEMTHGITNRMTGGGTGSCLQTTEAGGLGEGWSDALASWTEQKSGTITDFVLGDYVTNNPKGIRTNPYSTSKTTNPLTYGSIKSLTAVHRIGEVWANTLHNVYAALVAEHGWSATAKTNPDGTEGNIVYLHLFLDALRLQPCNPTFLTARTAWIQADANRYGGANKCLLWKAFASRGLGVNAANKVDNFDVPAGC